jgi:hypothetical protein
MTTTRLLRTQALSASTRFLLAMLEAAKDVDGALVCIRGTAMLCDMAAITRSQGASARLHLLRRGHLVRRPDLQPAKSWEDANPPMAYEIRL